VQIYAFFTNYSVSLLDEERIKAMAAPPISASTRKLIASLKQAKHRNSERLFVIEGTRAVLDTIPFFDVEQIVATPKWLTVHGHDLPPCNCTLLTAKNDEMARMSSLSTPQGVMAVCRMPDPCPPSLPTTGELALALDKVQDPGNLGTIIRVADWFGVTRIYASEDTVDLFNPKVIQATMGALARVNIAYCNLPETLAEFSKAMPVYGTFLDGGNLYDASLTQGGIVVMGNEGNGISAPVASAVTRRLKIPSYPAGRPTVESLNVSMATGIVLAEFRRRGH